MASRYYVITGGTMVHVAPHFSLCAPAYGSVGKTIAHELGATFRGRWKDICPPEQSVDEPPEVYEIRTRMVNHPASHVERELFEGAGIKFIETNEDLEKLIDYLVLQPETKGIVMAAAVCDWKPVGLEGGASWKNPRFPYTFDDLMGGTRTAFLRGMLTPQPSQEFGKQRPRLQTKHGGVSLHMQAANKIISRIRKTRKDIFLVGFKATTGRSEQEQYITGLGLLKNASCNLVFANDVHEHRNMVITPEEAKYHVTKDRKKAIKGLCEMIALRSQLHFTRSTVVEGDPIPWDSDEIPANLRKVVNHLISRGAYKPFQGKTVGHFATRGPKKGIIYTSRRKSNFNNLAEDGLLRIDAVGDDQVIAHGAKPSVGGQSQRIIFDQHPDVDCIVHAHVPTRVVGAGGDFGSETGVPNVRKVYGVREQRPFECGSHECGRNTSEGLHAVGHGIKAVMLQEHGPNICFSKDADPDRVIEFIEEYWDLEAKTGGPVSLEDAR